MLLLLRIYLVLHLAIAWGYGVLVFADPQRVAALFEIALPTNTALADFRAMYGGLMLGMGIVFLRGLLRAAWRAPAVLLAAATGGALAIGRLLTLLLDGPVGGIIYLNGAIDVLACVLGVWLLRRKDVVPSPADPRA